MWYAKKIIGLFFMLLLSLVIIGLVQKTLVRGQGVAGDVVDVLVQ